MLKQQSKSSIASFFDKPIEPTLPPPPSSLPIDHLEDDLDFEGSDDSSQEPQVQMHDKEPYMFNDKKYYYLNDNILNQKFGDFMNVDKQYNVQICIYQINDDCDIPFLQFLFDNSGEKIAFPNIDFHCPPLLLKSGGGEEQEHELEEEDSQEHIFFMNQCSQELLKVLPIQDLLSSEILQQIYKGFVEYENTLYVVFDSTKISMDIDIDNTKYKWAILDEIIIHHKLQGKEFSPEAVNLFIKHSYMMNIMNDQGNPILKPSLAYLCVRPDEIYKNVQENNPAGSINIIEDTIEHPWFGNHYFFSSNVLEETDVNKINRYALFTYNARYILKDIEHISQEEKDKFDESLEEDTTNLTLYFWEKNIQLWCIKTSEQFTLL